MYVKIHFIFIYVRVHICLCEFMYTCMCRCLRRQGQGIRLHWSPRQLGVAWCWCWDLNSGPPERLTSALKHWAIFPALAYTYSLFVRRCAPNITQNCRNHFCREPSPARRHRNPKMAYDRWKVIIDIIRASCHFSVVSSRTAPPRGGNRSPAHAQWQGLHVWIKCQHPTLCRVMGLRHLNIITTQGCRVPILPHYSERCIFQTLPEFSADVKVTDCS